jgi:ABC-type nitrate/sulfonate/bicarbonate transport system permease component
MTATGPGHGALGDASLADGAAGPARAGRRTYSILVRYFPPLVIFLALIGVWQLLAAFGGFPSYILPSPVSVLRAAFVDDRSVLVSAAGTTLTEIVIGFFVAVTVGFLLAVGLVASRPLRQGVYPLVIATQTIPILAIAPVLIIWFGFGILPKILVVMLFAFFPVVINTMNGMNSVERDTVYLMRVLGCGPRSILFRVRIPAAMPYFFTGVRQAAVISAIGAIAGEWVGAQKGLGPLMIGANSGLQTAVVFAAILFLSMIAVALFAVVTLVERVAIHWYYITRDVDASG